MVKQNMTRFLKRVRLTKLWPSDDLRSKKSRLSSSTSFFFFFVSVNTSIGILSFVDKNLFPTITFLFLWLTSVSNVYTWSLWGLCHIFIYIDDCSSIHKPFTFAQVKDRSDKFSWLTRLEKNLQGQPLIIPRRCPQQKCRKRVGVSYERRG